MTADLKLGYQFGYWSGEGPGDMIAPAKLAEDLGFDSVWTAESWGSDAFTPLSWIGAHTSRVQLCTGLVQLSARTPAATAMSAMTLDRLSGGRMNLGLGVSGPQVVEGWYGQPFPKPLARTMLNTRCLTIAGGTSEVLKNVVGERILGLPRET